MRYVEIIGDRSLKAYEKIRQLRNQFDGQTQAVRGSLIADLEKLQHWAGDKVRIMKDKNSSRSGL